MLNKKMFRAKSMSNEWVYGSLIEDYTNDCFYIIRNNMNDCRIDQTSGVITGKVTPVRKETICQYIEQLNYRGADFYEGDIIRTTLRHTDKFAENAIVLSDSCILKDGLGIIFPQDTLEYEIIGNVIDDSNLLCEDSIRWLKNYGWLRKD